ncbi:MAG TPA: hypothetical protein VJ836_05715 [Candidatus Saccharimonadales bacterium]|nr:hypothetical protein [Candidatus Saccharimonadales bacterium]
MGRDMRRGTRRFAVGVGLTGAVLWGWAAFDRGQNYEERTKTAVAGLETYMQTSGATFQAAKLAVNKCVKVKKVPGRRLTKAEAEAVESPIYRKNMGSFDVTADHRANGKVLTGATGIARLIIVDADTPPPQATEVRICRIGGEGPDVAFKATLDSTIPSSAELLVSPDRSPESTVSPS